MALSFPTAPCCGPSAALTRRIQHVPVTAPHWPHIFSTIVEAYVLSTTAAEVVPPSGRSPEQLWPMLRSWLAAFLPRSRVDLVRVGIASKFISDVLRWTGEVIRARGEEREKWYTGPGFQALLDFWIDLARKVCRRCRNVLMTTVQRYIVSRRSSRLDGRIHLIARSVVSVNKRQSVDFACHHPS